MKIKKSIWLPTVLLIYFAFMAIYFGKDLLLTGHSTQFYLISGAEILAIVLLFIFLRKKEKYREERERQDSAK